MRALLTGLAAIILASVIGVGGASPASADPDADLRFEASVTYELEPDDERVRVTMDISLTNLRPNEGLRYYYFDQISVPVPTEATNISAERVGGGTLSTSTETLDDPLWSALSVRLSPVLQYGSPQEIQLQYDLLSNEPRSDGWTRASPAYTIFPVYPVGDPGLASVTVIVPDVYDTVDVGGSEMDRTRSSDEIRFEATSIEEDEWWATLSARNDSLLDEREIQVDDQTVVLRYWPGDDKWADFLEEMVVEGIPVLEDLIGQPWPKAEEDLEIIESSAPHAYGYGGWYDLHNNVIEVGDQLNAHVVLHELSHSWFNGDTVAGTWLQEGLSDLYAYHGVVELDGYKPDRDPEPSTISETVPLASWKQAGSNHTEVDEYGYETSWWIFDQFYADLGSEAMTEVLTAVFDGLIPYEAGGERTHTAGDITWKRMLDLLEEVGESEAAYELFEEHVVDDDGLDLLAERNEAREAYAEFVAAADGWDAPMELRRAMTIWSFDRVGELVESAEKILGYRDDVLESLSPLGVGELPALEDMYQDEAKVADAIAEAERYLEITAVMTEAQERPDGALGALSWVGMTAAASESQLAEAATLLADGEVDEAELLSDEVLQDAQQSPLIGGVLIGQVLLCAGLLARIRRRRRRRRRRARRRAVGSDPWPIDELSSSPSMP